MKDLEQRLGCSPDEFCYSFEPLNIQSHIKGNMALGKVLESPSYQAKVREKVTEQENGYIEELVKVLSDQFPNVSTIRACLSQKKPMKDVSEADRIILKKLFLNQVLY